MSKTTRENHFWISYSDFITSMFFIMLILMVLAIVVLRKTVVEIEKEKKATEAQLKKIKEIEEAIKNINNQYFEYNPKHKKHILKIRVNFPTGISSMAYIDETTKSQLNAAGISIKNILEQMNKTYPQIQYLLIIEGQASKDLYEKNYELSYERALALKRFWEYNQINFPNNCEVLISGSGIGGSLRSNIEYENQRFLIHIVPKPGAIEAHNPTF